MLSTSARLLRPRIPVLFARSMSTLEGGSQPPTKSSGTESAGAKSTEDDHKANNAKEASEVKKEGKVSAVDRIIAQEATKAPNKVLENSMYTRSFRPKETYIPHDLNEERSQGARRAQQRNQNKIDPFVELNINPVHEYKNVYLLSNFITEMGRIKPSSKTGLTPKSQRRLAKAIKRARAFGLMQITGKVNPGSNFRSLGKGGN